MSSSLLQELYAEIQRLEHYAEELQSSNKIEEMMKVIKQLQDLQEIADAVRKAEAVPQPPPVHAQHPQPQLLAHVVPAQHYMHIPVFMLGLHIMPGLHNMPVVCAQYAQAQQQRGDVECCNCGNNCKLGYLPERQQVVYYNCPNCGNMFKCRGD